MLFEKKCEFWPKVRSHGSKFCTDMQLCTHPATLASFPSLRLHGIEYVQIRL